MQPRSLDHAGSQWQSIAELWGPSCHLTAWFAFGYLKEMRATFEFRFVSALGRCGAGSALYRHVVWQAWRRGGDAEQELVSMHLCGEKEHIGMTITWLKACAC